MKRIYTREELWAFVYRVDTIKKVHIAEDWLTRNVDDNDLWNDLMTCLSQISREIYAEQEGRAYHI